jgi:hypothetical protein
MPTVRLATGDGRLNEAIGQFTRSLDFLDLCPLHYRRYFLGAPNSVRFLLIPINRKNVYN